MLVTPSLCAATDSYVQPQWSAGLNASAAIADDARRARNDSGVSVDMAYRLQPRLEARASLVTYRFTLKDKSDEYAQLGLMFELLRSAHTDRRIAPFLSFGAGWLRSDTPSGNDSSLAATAGVGLAGFLSTNRRWKAEAFAKVRWDYGTEAPPDGPDFADTLIGVGIRYGFGAHVGQPSTQGQHDGHHPDLGHPAMQRQPSSRQADSDRDGIADQRDICPDTPIGFSVDSDGCAD